jgi:hypothetical protein
MRKLFFALLFAVPLFAGKVGDFAPTEVGTVWEYSYDYQHSYITIGINKDSLSIRVELLSKSVVGADTVILLGIREQGRSLRWADESGIRLADTIDTIVNVQYVDTVVISGDSICRQVGYRCPVFPFWKEQAIESDSISRLFSGIEPLNYIILKSGQITIESELKTGPYYATYLQNTGLISSENSYLGHNTIFTNIKLLSFNDKPVPTMIRQISDMVPRQSRTPRGIAKTVFVQYRTNITTGAFSISGKKIPTGLRVAPGLTIKVEQAIQSREERWEKGGNNNSSRPVF